MSIRWILFVSLIVIINFSLPSTSYAQESLTVDDFLAAPKLFDAEFSPDGRYLAMILERKDTRTLFIRDFETKGFPITGTMTHQFIRPSSVSWANNERLLVNLLVPAGTKISKLETESKSDPDFDIDDYYMGRRTISMDVSAQDVVVLMDNKRYSKRNRSLSRINNFLPDDDKHVIMPAWGNRSLELLKVNVYNGDAKLVVKGGWRTYKYLTDEKGRPTYRFDYFYYSKKIRIFEYTKDKRWDEVDEIYLNQNDEESLNQEGLLLFGFGDNLDLIYRERNEETGFYEIIKRKRGGAEKEVIASLPNKDIHSPIYDKQTNKYLGYRIQDDLIRNVYNDKTRQLHYDKIGDEIGHSNFGVRATRKHGKRVVIKVSSSDNPGSFYIYNYEENNLSFLDDKYEKLVPENIGIPGKVHYRTRDGVKIRMYTLFPSDYKGGTAFPMVILPHGGPHARDSVSFDRFAQFIATRGYIVIQPNFRGSSGYGQKFEEAGNRQWGGVMQDDLTDAVNFMIKNGYADPKKICIVGISYGGYAALMGAVKTPDLFQCSVSINGVSHLKEQIEFDIDSAKSNDEKIEEYVYKTIGHPEKDSAMLDANSPALNAKSIKIPILLIAGEEDTVVPVEQSELMEEALEDNNKVHQYFELEDTGHNVFYSQKNFEKVYTEVERFLGKYLKN
jgi:dipeptidyl aminopeptidase/acylaminoacyl peptidase